MSYESPVEIICRGFTAKLEGALMEAIHTYGISVDKDELIKALQYDRNQYEKGFADGWRLHESKWISVEERLPDPNKAVLVCKTFIDKPYIDIGYVKDAETCCCASDEFIIKPWLHKLTHWMPLPEPPKGE